MSSEGEDELRTEAALPKSRPEASAAGGSGDDSTQVVRLSESGAADSVDQLKTLLQSAGFRGLVWRLRNRSVPGVIVWIAFWGRVRLGVCIWGMIRSCVVLLP